MKINFKKLKEHLIKDYEEEEVIECIEKLKELPYGMFGAMDDCINEFLYLFSHIRHEIRKCAIKKGFQGSCGRNIVLFTG